MIQRVCVELEYDGSARLWQSDAYFLYGALCQKMPPDLAEAFHQAEITPLRQHLELGEAGHARWVLDLFGDCTLPLLELIEHTNEIFLEARGVQLFVKDRTVPPALGTRELLERTAAQEPARRIRIHFVSPCGFRSDGRYVSFPSAEWIVQSLFSRWNALMQDSLMQDEDAMRMLSDGVAMRQYRLASTGYALKGQRIPAFVGEVTLSSRLSAPMQLLWNMLIEFAPYSGLGIKAALGMGAVSCERVLPRASSEN